MIVGALAAGAASGLRDTAMGAVKDAYAGLHDMVRRRFAGRQLAETALAEYEKAPQMWAAPLSAELAAVGADTDPQIVAAAERVMALMDEVPAALEVDRVVSRDGTISLANHRVLAPGLLTGHRVSVRIQDATLMFFDPDKRELLRTSPNPLTWEQSRSLRGARPAGPPPRPSIEPITIQRRASNSGEITIAGQKIALGRHHASQVFTVHVSDTTVIVELPRATIRTFPRTTTQTVRVIEAQRPSREDPNVH